MEVVLPDGTLVRTGMGGLPEPGPTESGVSPDQQKSNKCWQLFNYGFGPYNDGIFSQSSLGIVVKMGMWVRSDDQFFRIAEREDKLADALDS
jgi:hypothetical protein